MADTSGLKTVQDRRRQPRQTWLATAAVLACVVGITPITQAQPPERFEYHEPHLGTIVDITLYASDKAVANDSSRAAYARIRELNRILSDYDSDSEVMRLCQTAGTGTAVKVSPELFDVLSRSLELARATDGAFDVTIGPVVRLWRIARRRRQLPAADDLAAARQLVGWQRIKLDAQQRTVELQKNGMLLDFGGIAKGYIADQARERLFQSGTRQCLVAVAGDLAAGDPPPGREAWKIGIAPSDDANAPPKRFLKLKNVSVSTAGDAYQFVEIDGIRYSHIVDPTTGLGLTRRVTVTVIAPSGIAADGLDTSISIIGPKRGLELLSQYPGTAAIMTTVDGANFQTIESAHFADHLYPAPAK